MNNFRVRDHYFLVINVQAHTSQGTILQNVFIFESAKETQIFYIQIQQINCKNNECETEIVNRNMCWW